MTPRDAGAGGRSRSGGGRTGGILLTHKHTCVKIVRNARGLVTRLKAQTTVGID